MDERFLKLNISGQMFMIERAHLGKYPNSRLALLTKDNPSFLEDTNEYYFDTSSRYMDNILDAYRDNKQTRHGVVSFDSNTNAMVIMEQLNFWGLEPTVLAPNVHRRVFDELKLLRRLAYNNKVEQAPAGIQGKLYRILEMPRSSRIAGLWCALSLILIFVSLLTFMLETSPNARTFFQEEDHYSYRNLTHRRNFYLFAHSRPNIGFMIVEISITMILLTEHVLRFAVSPCKRTFYKGFFNVTDMLGIFPVMIMYLLILMQHVLVDIHVLHHVGTYIQIFVALHCARMLRIFRYLKHACNYRAMRIVLCALTESIGELFSWLLLVFISMYIFANAVYFAEMTHLHPEEHSYMNPFTGLWWAVVTITTVGYGDFIPMTFLGRSLGSVCVIVGVLSTALIVSVLNNHMQRVYTLSKSIPAYNSESMRLTYDKVNEYLAELRQCMSSGEMDNGVLRPGNSYAPLIEDTTNL